MDPEERRRHAAWITALLLGGVLGALAVAWRFAPAADEPSVAPPPGAQVRLVLHDVVADRARAGTILVEGVLLHSRTDGAVTVTRIHRPGRSIRVDAPRLPARLSVNHSFHRVRVGIRPRDCALATEWTPSALPLTLTWRDEDGTAHSTPAGEHDAALEIDLLGGLDAACAPSD